MNIFTAWFDRPGARLRCGTIACCALSTLATIGCGNSDAERVRQLEATQQAMAKQMQEMDSARRAAEQRASRASEDSARAAEAYRETGRVAITAVMKQLFDRVAALRARNYPGGLEGARRKFADFHSEIVEIGTYNCPPDFRTQFQRLITASRLLADAAEEVPADAFEAFIRGMEQAESENPDISGARAQRTMRERYEAFLAELQELAAIAKSYGVT